MTRTSKQQYLGSEECRAVRRNTTGIVLEVLTKVHLWQHCCWEHYRVLTFPLGAPPPLPPGTAGLLSLARTAELRDAVFLARLFSLFPPESRERFRLRQLTKLGRERKARAASVAQHTGFTYRLLRRGVVSAVVPPSRDVELRCGTQKRS